MIYIGEKTLIATALIQNGGVANIMTMIIFMSMSKMTKGQKNELARQEFQKRVDLIKEYGYTVKGYSIGGDWHYELHKNEICIHPGGCYETPGECVRLAESIINQPPATL